MKMLDLRSYRDQVNIISREDGNIVWNSIYYDWYFYIELKHIPLLVSIVPPEYVKRITPGKKFAKVYGDYWEFRKNWIEYLHSKDCITYEADFDLADRYRYDHIKDIEIDDDVDLLYFDIETDDRRAQIEVGRDYIVSFAGIDNKGNTHYVELEEMSPTAEKKFLETVFSIIKKYQIIAGWNINKFDTPYLRLRAKLHDLKMPWTGRYDMFERAKHIYRFDSTIKSFSLENVSQTFLDRGKIKHEKSIFELWESRDPMLRDYNIEDCQLCFDIDKKLNICGMMILQSKWCRVPPRKFSLYALIDSVIIQKSHELGRPVPTNLKALRAFDDELAGPLEDPYMGAEVLDPVIGFHKNTYVFDFKSLYPSIMMTCNIGYDTLMLKQTENLDDMIIAPGPYTIARESTNEIIPTYFKRTPSCIAETIRTLIVLRNEYKKLKLEFIETGRTEEIEYQRVVSDEIIVKELSNSVYGIMGMTYGRYYNVHVAESITLTGRWILRFAQRHFSVNRNYNVIYGDTDSIFIQTDKDLDLDYELEMFHTEIEDELRDAYLVPKSYIQLNFDKHYTRFLLVAKKTYAGHCDNMEGKKTDKLYVRGIAYIKRNSFQWAAKRQRALLEDLLRGVITEKQVLNRIREFKYEFHATEFKADELKITQRVGKETYSNNALIGKLAARKKQLTGVHPIGTELEYIITEAKSPLKGCLLEDYTGRYSKIHYWENLSRPLFEQILDVVDPGKNIDYATLWE